MEASATAPEYTYERRLRASTGWWNIEWREMWQYRDLLYLLVRRDFVAKYAQSVLGPAWFIIQPLLTTVIFTIVFGGIAKIPTGGVPPLLFYLCNQIAWTYFASSFSSVSTTFSANQHIFSKVYFPRLIVPIASLVSNGFTLAIQFGTFLAFFAYFKLTGSGEGFGFTLGLVLLPVILIHLAILATGFGFWMAAATAKYRDLTQLAAVIIQLWMYATPIIYPMSQVPERWKWLVALNPVTAPVELFRYALLGVGETDARVLIVSIASTAIVVVSGLGLFSRAERTFVDVV